MLYQHAVKEHAGMFVWFGIYLLQETAMQMFNGKGRICMVQGSIFRILVRKELVDERPGGDVYGKHRQEYDRQYLI